MANRPCPKPGCSHLVNLPERPCPVHGDEIRNRRLQRDRERAPRSRAIYDAEWRRLRRDVIAEVGVCQAPGCGVREGLECHHVRPVREAPELRLVRSNLVVLCAAHHSRVTRATGR